MYVRDSPLVEFAALVLEREMLGYVITTPRIDPALSEGALVPAGRPDLHQPIALQLWQKHQN